MTSRAAGGPTNAVMTSRAAGGPANVVMTSSLVASMGERKTNSTAALWQKEMEGWVSVDKGGISVDQGGSLLTRDHS